jgi:hypothetical protein
MRRITMKDKKKNSKLVVLPIEPSIPEMKNNFPGYPAYNVDEDIYHKYQKDKYVDPDDITKAKKPMNLKLNRIKDFSQDVTGTEVDIPGSELDDDIEAIGSEGEENNFFSLGSDNHENQG